MRMLIGLLAMAEALTLFSLQQQTECLLRVQNSIRRSGHQQHVSTVSFLVSHLAEYPEKPWLVRHSLH
jgi:hypothetical protein